MFFFWNIRFWCVGYLRLPESDAHPHHYYLQRPTPVSHPGQRDREQMQFRVLQPSRAQHLQPGPQLSHHKYAAQGSWRTGHWRTDGGARPREPVRAAHTDQRGVRAEEAPCRYNHLRSRDTWHKCLQSRFILDTGGATHKVRIILFK